MDDFCIIYNLGSLIRVLTSYENPSKPSCIDLIMLKNSPKRLHNACAIAKGLSDFYKMTILCRLLFVSKNQKQFNIGTIKIFQIMPLGRPTLRSII